MCALLHPHPPMTETPAGIIRAVRHRKSGDAEQAVADANVVGHPVNRRRLSFHEDASSAKRQRGSKEKLRKI